MHHKSGVIGGMPDRGNADVPTRLLRHLDALGAFLAGRGDAIALIGLGSVGVTSRDSTTIPTWTSS
jgi:hypothetical protein